jgi:hypothetical protein
MANTINETREIIEQKEHEDDEGCCEICYCWCSHFAVFIDDEDDEDCEDDEDEGCCEICHCLQTNYTKNSSN